MYRDMSIQRLHELEAVLSKHSYHVSHLSCFLYPLLFYCVLFCFLYSVPFPMQCQIFQAVFCPLYYKKKKKKKE